MKRFLLLLFVVGLAVGFAPKEAPPSRITIKNVSPYRIDHIYFSPIDKARWGADILDDDEVLEPGESIELEVDCDIWDVKVVDIDGIGCEFYDVKICGDDEIWEIDDLERCH